MISRTNYLFEADTTSNNSEPSEAAVDSITNDAGNAIVYEKLKKLFDQILSHSEDTEVGKKLWSQEAALCKQIMLDNKPTHGFHNMAW